jgi:hypothetical protein
MRCGFDWVHLLSKDCRVCMDYNSALVTVRHPPSHNAAVITAPLLLAILFTWNQNPGMNARPVGTYFLIFFTQSKQEEMEALAWSSQFHEFVYWNTIEEVTYTGECFVGSKPLSGGNGDFG